MALRLAAKGVLKRVSHRRSGSQPSPAQTDRLRQGDSGQAVHRAVLKWRGNHDGTRSSRRVLILLGGIALAVRGFSYTREEEVLDVGPIEASVEQERSVAIPPIAGIIAIAVGIVLVVVDHRKA